DSVVSKAPNETTLAKAVASSAGTDGVSQASCQARQSMMAWPAWCEPGRSDSGSENTARTQAIADRIAAKKPGRGNCRAGDSSTDAGDEEQRHALKNRRDAKQQVKADGPDETHDQHRTATD